MCTCLLMLSRGPGFTMTPRRGGQRVVAPQATAHTAAASIAPAPATASASSSHSTTTAATSLSEFTTPPRTKTSDNAVSCGCKATSPGATPSVPAAAPTPAPSGSTGVAAAAGTSVAAVGSQCRVLTQAAPAAVLPTAAADTTAPCTAPQTQSRQTSSSDCNQAPATGATPTAADSMGRQQVIAAAAIWDSIAEHAAAAAAASPGAFAAVVDPSTGRANVSNTTLPVWHWLSERMSEQKPWDLSKLETRAMGLLQQGQAHKAFPLLCRWAHTVCLLSDPYGRDAFEAVHRVLMCAYERDSAAEWCVWHWVLQRAVQHWGLDSPDLRRLVQQAAGFVADSYDPTDYQQLGELVIQTAQQLPGGLGWANTVVAPVPDQQTYYKHVLWELTNPSRMAEGDYSTAKTLYERCAAYYQGLGPHWLATPRRVKALCGVGQCVVQLETPEAAQEYFMKAKRLAQKELGMSHEATLDATWEVSG